jgi:hypothetical protein
LRVRDAACHAVHGHVDAAERQDVVWAAVELSRAEAVELPSPVVVDLGGEVFDRGQRLGVCVRLQFFSRDEFQPEFERVVVKPSPLAKRVLDPTAQVGFRLDCDPGEDDDLLVEEAE